MIQSPFLDEVHVCKGIMKKLRKKIYKFNINKLSKTPKQGSTIRDALTVLERRGVPNFLREELEKYSDLTFSSLSGFSLSEFRPVSELSRLTQTQEHQISQMYEQNRGKLKKRRVPLQILKLDRRRTSPSNSTQTPISSTTIEDIFDDVVQNLSSSLQSNIRQSDDLFGTINNSHSLYMDDHNSEVMFHSTMMNFGNQIDMDSEEFLFRN